MRVVRLDTVCSITMGQAPSGDTYNDRRLGLPLIAGAGDFGSDGPAPKKHTTASGIRSAEAGDVILGIRASIGAKVLADRPYCLGRGVAGLRAGAGLYPRFLWHWLDLARPDLVRKGRGATFLQVNKGDVGSLGIPLPPIEEQRRIAAVLDAADALRAKRREAIAKLDSLTQAIFIDMFGNLEATQNCRMLSIEHLADVLIGFPFKSTTFTGDESGVRICRGANVLPGRVSWKHTERVPTDIASARDRFELCRGDVLLAMDRPWITEGLKLAQVDEATAGSLLVQRVARLRALPGTPATYLYQLLRQQAFSRHCEPTETTIPHISPRDIKSYEVPAAPAELVRSFDRLSQHIECQAALLKQDESKLDTLFASLQQRAFRGEL